MPFKDPKYKHIRRRPIPVDLHNIFNDQKWLTQDPKISGVSDISVQADKKHLPSCERYRHITSFAVTFNVDDRFNKHAGKLSVTYFGKVKDGKFYATSFSYSVQHLPKYTQESRNEFPYQTAKFGLQIIGVAF